MPIQESDKKVFSLLEVTASIQRTLSERYSKSFWVKAEMNKLNYYSQSGHCFPELVEKNDGKVIAQLRSVLWSDTYLKCNRKFQRVLKEPLRDGIKILFEARINFDAVHGLSLVILDIDPSYTLGDLEREKQETIQRLVREDIAGRNKSLPFPLLPQRVAVISVESSKGYVDFDRVISLNTFGYRFFTMLFPAVLQGDRSIDSIIYQLSRVRKVIGHFDSVAIIRGGGGDVGLSSYNSYRLAREIALFPIPVLTGIGHATNETVAEMVANYNAITPTKLAEYLLQCFHNVAVPVKDAEQKIHDKGIQMIEREKNSFHTEVKLFRSVTENLLLTNKHDLTIFASTLHHQSMSIFKTSGQQLEFVRDVVAKRSKDMIRLKSLEMRQATSHLKGDVRETLNTNSMSVTKLQAGLPVQATRVINTAALQLGFLEKNINNMDPRNVLRRGYSITLRNGSAVKDINDLKEGDTITTEVFNGKITSTISNLHKESNEQ
ncbi:MAG TPA: exodeoxyribonuclease VII large subunit [Chryseosolibacter sp.]